MILTDSHRYCMARTTLVSLFFLGGAIALGRPPLALGFDEPLAVFHIAASGEPIALPVTIRGKTRLFLLDTGAGAWSFDESLVDLLGARQKTTFVGTANGPRRMELYQAPPATLGPLELLPDQPAILTDCSDDRAMLGIDVYGILGIQALRDRAFTIDFDAATVSFLDRASDQVGQPLPLLWRTGALAVLVDVPGVGPEEFLIDTGEYSFTSGSITQDLLGKLLRGGNVHLMSTKVARHGAASTDRVGMARIGQFRLGPFTHRDLLVTTRASVNTIGLWYLSRYIVTFDLPNAIMYLRPSKNYERKDRYDLSGVGLIKYEGKTFVVALKPDGPGERAGLAFGDEITAIDNSSAADRSLVSMIHALSEPGAKHIRYSRDDVAMKAVLSLKEASEE